jgi:glycosyltransferase involved in cell wall biosynthesis
MKIGILTIASPDSGGVFQYTLSITEAIKKITESSNKYEVIQIRNESFIKVFDKEYIIKNQKTPIGSKLRRLIHAFTGFKIGSLAPDIDVDLIISPTITLLPYHMEKPYIVTIHDFQHKYYPEFFTIKEKISREIVYRTGKKANLVICESNYVKHDIMKFLNIDENKIKVLPSPPPSYLQTMEINNENLLTLREKYNLPEGYIFYPAQFWHHKNHINLLRALKYIKDNYNLEIPLILVGSKKNNFERVMNEIQNLGLTQQVKYLGYVPHEDMPYLYKLATALVMPTLFESVSMPIWEAFYLGCPVVSSNVCALPEQVGDAGLIFDPYNIKDIAEKILIIWTNENLRNELINKGFERVKDLTIENYAKDWEKILEEVKNDIR